MNLFSTKFKFNIFIYLILLLKVLKADESIENNSFLHEITTISSKQTKAPTRKIYLRNLTVNKGETVVINCPLINHLIESDDDKQLKTDVYFYENKQYNYKTVVWSKEEHNFPKILFHNNEKIIKNWRFFLENHNNKENSQKTTKRQQQSAQSWSSVANLHICRVKHSDNGWYSCYIVKNTKTDHDLKFYTYLNVLNNESHSHDDKDDDYYYYYYDSSSDLEACYSSWNKPKTESIHQTNMKIRFLQKDVYQDEKIGNKETLKINPKYKSLRKYSSVQSNCIYNGPNYLSIKLVWLKNGQTLVSNNRFFILDNKQNNTIISILKISYSLLVDSGLYQCIAVNPNVTKYHPHLNDSFRLTILSESRFRPDQIMDLIISPYRRAYNNAVQFKSFEPVQLLLLTVLKIIIFIL